MTIFVPHYAMSGGTLLCLAAEQHADQIAAMLTDGRWTHDYPITLEQAQKIGLPVGSGLPVEVYQLMDLFPQTMQQRPSVQYIPVPYKKLEQRGKPG